MPAWFAALPLPCRRAPGTRCPTDASPTGRGLNVCTPPSRLYFVSLCSSRHLLRALQQLLSTRGVNVGFFLGPASAYKHSALPTSDFVSCRSHRSSLTPPHWFSGPLPPQVCAPAPTLPPPTGPRCPATSNSSPISLYLIPGLHFLPNPPCVLESSCMFVSGHHHHRIQAP